MLIITLKKDGRINDKKFQGWTATKTRSAEADTETAIAINGSRT